MVYVFTRNPKFRKIEQEGKEKGFIVVEPGLDKDAARNREYKDREIKDKIRKYAENEIRKFDVGE